MGTSPITSWQRDEERMETGTDFIFWGSKIIVDGHYSHEIKRCLLLGRKVTSITRQSIKKTRLVILDRVLKSRDIPLSTKVHRVNVMVCPVVMYGYKSWIHVNVWQNPLQYCKIISLQLIKINEKKKKKSWTIKKPECRRIDVFKLWCWRRLLRVPWTARRSNQSNLKKINTDYRLEGLMLKL